MRAALIAAAVLTLSASIGALDVYVAPLLYIDETAGNRQDTGKVQGDLLRAIWGVETGVELQFDRLRDNRVNAPQSITDAAAVCRSERVEYLLYGYVTRREHSIQAEVRLFDYANRRVMGSFFGMDDSAHYERLINDVARKILVFIGGAFKLEVEKEEAKMMRLEVPIGIGYWTPADRDWIEVMLGTFTIWSGVEFTPKDRMFVVQGKMFYISTGLEVKYRLGVGNPQKYKAYNSAMQFTMPVRMNVKLAGRHEVSMGVGFVYFVEIFSMADKYAENRNYVYNNVGMNISMGYRFTVDEAVGIFFRNDFDILFNEKAVITYAPVIGMSVKIYEKEAREKW